MPSAFANGIQLICKSYGRIGIMFFYKPCGMIAVFLKLFKYNMSVSSGYSHTEGQMAHMRRFFQGRLKQAPKGSCYHDACRKTGQYALQHI